jgi:hypothetical protein
MLGKKHVYLPLLMNYTQALSTAVREAIRQRAMKVINVSAGGSDGRSR